jgi:hypothetical protein
VGRRGDYFFQSVRACGGQIVSITGMADEWVFVVRFPSNDGIDRFREHCEAHGLTDVQHEALLLAIEQGYFDIPCKCSTCELVRDVSVSVSERFGEAL